MKLPKLTQSGLLLLVIFYAMAGMPTKAQTSPENSNIANTVVDIVRSYREIIILFIDEDSLTPEQKIQASIIGKIIYHQNITRLNRLQSTIEQSDTALKTFLNLIETDNTLWDADKLVFKATLEDLLDDHISAQNTKLAKRIQANIHALESIQNRYDDEISDIFSRLGTRAIQPKREAWSTYIGFLRQQFSQDTILNQYDADASLTSKYRAQAKNNKNSAEIFGLNFPKKTLLLTFDDGPHKKYTQKILSILKQYKIKPVFFMLAKISVKSTIPTRSPYPKPQTLASN